ncbi:MAG: hypothetical protein ACLFT3_09995 [Cyclobacteriaceae bacterium]
MIFKAYQRLFHHAHQVHVVVSFSNGLLRQYGKMIPFRQNLQGEAEIITKNRKLLERILTG